MKIKNKYTLNEVLDILKEKKIDRDDYELLYSDFETQIGKDGYLQFKTTEKDNWKNVHTLVNRYFNSEEYDKKYVELIETKIEKCLITHHVNFFEKENKLNNHPDNLCWLGKEEHIKFHSLLKNEIHLKVFWDKIWNPENPEYENNYELREKERERLKKLGKINSIKMNEKIWHGENNEKHRETMKPIQSENAKKSLKELWHGENNEEYRKIRTIIGRESISDFNEQYWNGEGNEERRIAQSEIMKKRSNELWYGENNEEYRKKRKEILNDPKMKLKMVEGKIFGVFNKIIKAGEVITDETFLKYKSKFSTYPKTVFGSIKKAIKKYKDYPKRVKV